MANDLTKRLATDLAPSSAQQGQIEQHKNDRNVQAVQRKTMEQLAVQRGQELKAEVGMKQAERLTVQATRHITDMADARQQITEPPPGRSQDTQDFIDEQTMEAVSLGADQVKRILNIGVGKIADVIDQPIVPDKPKWRL